MIRILNSFPLHNPMPGSTFDFLFSAMRTIEGVLRCRTLLGEDNRRLKRAESTKEKSGELRNSRSPYFHAMGRLNVK